MPEIEDLKRDFDRLETELALVRIENAELRKSVVTARHHIAMALSALNHNQPQTDSRIYTHG